MFKGWKQQWRAFRGARPGRRFEERYKRNQKQRHTQAWLVRFLKPVAGVILVLAGVVFCVIPGPGLPLIIIGAGLLAEEARPIARAMDGLEVRLRKVVRWGRAWWRRAPWFAKLAVILLSVPVAGAVLYGAYRFLCSH